jgi:yecA family protein
MAYQEINDIFQQHDSDISAAEAHGIASAMLCVDARADVNRWLEELFDDDAHLVDEEIAALVALFNRTQLLLNPDETEFGFDLFLPNNDDLQELVVALTAWCQGFLWGIGYSHSAADWSGETNGILRDIVEITKLDQDVEESDEEEEAFIQLQEYLRAAILIIRDELQQSHPSVTH